jgi:hypothetical protein
MAIVVPDNTPRPRYIATVALRRPRPTLPLERKGDHRKKFGGDTWWNECGRKSAVFAAAEAKLIAFVLSGKPRFMRRGEVLHAYECPWCEWWHIGHRRKT